MAYAPSMPYSSPDGRYRPADLTSPYDPTSSTYYARYNRVHNDDEFQIERKSPPTSAPPIVEAAAVDRERILQANIDTLLRIKADRIAVTGTCILEHRLVLFFEPKSGIARSLHFPIDVDYSRPPAFDVLEAACVQHETPEINFIDRDCLQYPGNLPLTTTFELSNHAILDAVRTTMFEDLPPGQYLIAVRDRLHMLRFGVRCPWQPTSLREGLDGRVATLIVTLPVRYRGGAIKVRDSSKAPHGPEETFYANGGKDGVVEWIAFLPTCDYEVETIESGCRVFITYGVYLPDAVPPHGNPVPSARTSITPSDDFIDALSPILNIMRGYRIAFFLMHDYGVDPSEMVAEALVPRLKGGDHLLYQALKYFKLNPELHWIAGGYIWPIDRTVELAASDAADAAFASSISNNSAMSPRHRHHHNQHGHVSPARGAFGAYSNPPPPVGASEAEHIRWRIEGTRSGAVHWTEAGIEFMTSRDGAGNADSLRGKERVPFVAGGELQKLVVHAITVVHVP